jgi:hypothetical protein
MQALIPIGWQQLFDQGLDWLHRYVLLPALLAQLVCVLSLLKLLSAGLPRTSTITSWLVFSRRSHAPAAAVNMTVGRYRLPLGVPARGGFGDNYARDGR